MSFLPELEPLPHRETFRKHNLKLGQVAHHIGYSYGRTCSVLSGNYKPSREMLARLDRLVEELEKETTS